jgi:Arc/MetJ-type ribon-helix-helix transcriptional regulator
MGAITVRLTDELQELIDGEVRYGGHADGEAYIQSLLMDEHARRMERLQAALDEGERSGLGTRSIEQIVADARERYRSQH